MLGGAPFGAEPDFVLRRRAVWGGPSPGGGSAVAGARAMGVPQRSQYFLATAFLKLQLPQILAREPWHFGQA